MRNPAYVLIVLFLAFIFSYADRGAVYVLAPSIKASMGLTLVEVSLLQGFAFALFFAIAGIPLGRIADRLHRRNLLVVGITFWSLATVACGLSTTFWQLFAARIAVGIGEACLIPATASLLSDIYPPTTRGRALAAVQVGVPLGSLLAMVGSGWALTWLESSDLLRQLGWGVQNWQAVFIGLGAPGLIVAAMMLGVREPARREIAAGDGPAPTSGVIRLFRERPLWFTAFFLIQAMATTLAYAIMAMAPTLYISVYHLSPAIAGSITGGMMVGSAIAYATGGMASDALRRRWPEVGRTIGTILLLPLALPAMLWVYFARDVTSLTAALAVGLFVATFMSAGSVPALSAVTPNRLRGQLVAIQYLGMNLLGLGVTPTLIAWLAQQRAGGEAALQWAMATVGLFAVAGSFLLWPVVFSSYRTMRKYEVEEFAATA